MFFCKRDTAPLRSKTRILQLTFNANFNSDCEDSYSITKHLLNIKVASKMLLSFFILDSTVSQKWFTLIFPSFVRIFVLKAGKRGMSVVSGPEVEIKTLKEFVDFIKKTGYDCIVKVLPNEVCELELFDNFEEK
jgi:hypothetical protein